MTRSHLRIAAMIASAVAVTGIATAAVTATVSSGPPALSPQEVDGLLAAGSGTATPTGTATGAGTPTATVTPTGTGTTAGATGTATATSGPGDVVANLIPATVTVRCDGDLASLVSWSPKSGFRSDDPVRGPAAQVSIRFESDVYEDYKVTATCTDNTAHVRLGPDDDHGGGGRGSDG